MPGPISGSRYAWGLALLIVTACGGAVPHVVSSGGHALVRPHGQLPPYPAGTLIDPVLAPMEVGGGVLDRGRPAAGVEVSLVEERTWRSIALRTGADGVYRSRIMRPGRYHIHYYNDRDQDRVGFWKTRTLVLLAGQSGVWPAWDVHLRGMRNDPPQGATVALPLSVRIVPHPQALRVWFRLHDRGGPGGQAHFVSPVLAGQGLERYTYPSGAARPGFQLWGYQWDAGAAGEGGCLFQDVSIRGQ